MFRISFEKRNSENPNLKLATGQKAKRQREADLLSAHDVAKNKVANYLMRLELIANSTFGLQ